MSDIKDLRCAIRFSHSKFGCCNGFLYETKETVLVVTQPVYFTTRFMYIATKDPNKPVSFPLCFIEYWVELTDTEYKEYINTIKYLSK